MRQRLAVVTCSAVALLLGWTAAAWPCSCVPPDAVRGLREADGAFVGALVSKGGAGLFGSFHSDTVVKYDFTVSHPLKGGLGATVTVHAPQNGASCGIEVGVGRRTGLLLDRRNGRWESNLCRQVDADKLLEAAVLAGPVVDGYYDDNGPSPRSPLIPAVAFTLGAAALLAVPATLALRLARRRARRAR